MSVASVGLSTTLYSDVDDMEGCFFFKHVVFGQAEKTKMPSWFLLLESFRTLLLSL